MHFLLGNEIFRLDHAFTRVLTRVLAPWQMGWGVEQGGVEFPPCWAGEQWIGSMPEGTVETRKSLSQVGPIFLPFVFEYLPFLVVCSAFQLLCCV